MSITDNMNQKDINTLLLFGGGALALYYFTQGKAFKGISSYDMVADSGFLTTGSGEYPIAEKEISGLNYNDLLLRTATPAGDITTYKVPFDILTPYEKWLISKNAYNITPSGKLEKQPTKILTDAVKKKTGTISKGSYYTETSGIKQNFTQDAQKISVRTNPVETKNVVTIQKNEISKLDNKPVSRSIDTRTGQITTYKGTPTQIKVGKTINFFKNLF